MKKGLKFKFLFFVFDTYKVCFSFLRFARSQLFFLGLRKDNPAYYGMRSSTSNFATELYRLESLQFQALGAQNEESYFSFPNWAVGHRWGKVKSNFGIDTDPIDQIQSKIHLKKNIKFFFDLYLQFQVFCLVENALKIMWQWWLVFTTTFRIRAEKIRSLFRSTKCD